MPTSKTPKTPLAQWPGGAKPQTPEAIKKNLVEARKRLDVCIAKKSELWAKIMDESAEGFLQRITRFRDEAEQQSQWAIRLETQIEKWDDKLRSLAAADAMPEADRNLVHIYLQGHPQQRQMS